MKRTAGMILFAGMLLVAACSSKPANAPAEQQETAKRVKTAEVAAVSMGVPVKVEAVLAPSSRLQLTAEVSGKLLAEHIEVGQTVEQGQLLFELDPSDYKATLEKAQLSKERVLIDLENSKEKLREDKPESLNLLKISLKEAELSIQEAGRNIEKTKITSPIAGIVTLASGYSAGQQVNAGQQLAQIEQLDPLYVEAAITEKDLLVFREKQQLQVYLPLLEQTLNADILYISPSVQDQKQNGFSLRAKLPNADGVLRPGMSAQVILDDRLAQKTVAVPISAVLTEDGQSFVYTLSEPTKVKRTKVETGRKNQDYTEITAGLKEGDTIVVVGQSLLSDGDTVEIVGQGEKTP
ncbi:efflux RND transporter periplasmic adaptor subunit [Paenibacillus turpanensis]|uniref:efflux RND transporter periplasmic adaptor subunit n=1 Tax=Paenibacillus turpanensis TaxID=2689078 RepID=UPI00140CA1E6|nr:efflux RND transporter periplasmic adaptor subunit [Paenibacillus turpanensis]